MVVNIYINIAEQINFIVLRVLTNDIIDIICRIVRAYPKIHIKSINFKRQDKGGEPSHYKLQAKPVK